MFTKATRRTAWVVSALAALTLGIAPAEAGPDDTQHPAAAPPTMLAATALPPLGSNADGWSAALWQDHYVKDGKADLYLVSPTNGYYRVGSVPAGAQIVAISPDASKVVVQDWVGTINLRIWDVRARTETITRVNVGHLDWIRFTYPTGRNLLLIHGEVSNRYATRSTLSGQNLGTTKIGNYLVGAIQSFNGDKLVFDEQGEYGGIVITNNATGQIERTLRPPVAADECFPNRSQDADHVLVLCSARGEDGLGRSVGIFSAPVNGGTMQTVVPEPAAAEPAWVGAYPTATKGLLLEAGGGGYLLCKGRYGLRKDGTNSQISIVTGKDGQELETVIGDQAYVSTGCDDDDGPKGVFRYDLATGQAVPVIGDGAWWGGTVRSVAVVDRHA